MNRLFINEQNQIAKKSVCCHVFHVFHFRVNNDADRKMQRMHGVRRLVNRLFFFFQSFVIGVFVQANSLTLAHVIDNYGQIIIVHIIN